MRHLHLALVWPTFLAATALISWKSPVVPVVVQELQVGKKSTKAQLEVQAKESHNFSSDASCSCMNTTAERDCCRRALKLSHKFGSVLMGTAFRDMMKVYKSLFIAGETHPINYEDKTDFRHVFVTRNWYDSMVSGYLYHKSGNECWLDINGRTRKANRTYEWESYITFNHTPGNNRTICQYLVEESTQEGLQVYTEWALNKWYRDVAQYWLQAKAHNETRILHLCYEEIMDPASNALQKAVEFLFPGGVPALEVKMQKASEGHSTTSSTSAEERNALLSMVKRMDRALFYNAIATSNALFGCGELV